MIIKCNISSRQPIRAEVSKKTPIQVKFFHTHVHTNKGILDGITQALLDGRNNAVSQVHTHANKDLIDSITQIKVNNWDAGYEHSHTTGNPHNTNKSDLGLGNVDNTADIDKPISNAVQQALNNKSNSDHTHTDYATQIQNILTILASDDTTLDEIQEIVNYIKQNKEVLDTLSISNIAGLTDALSNKSNIGHHHNINDIDGLLSQLSSIDSKIRSQSFISSLIFG